MKIFAKGLAASGFNGKWLQVKFHLKNGKIMAGTDHGFCTFAPTSDFKFESIEDAFTDLGKVNKVYLKNLERVYA